MCADFHISQNVHFLLAEDRNSKDLVLLELIEPTLFAVFISIACTV